MEGAFFPDILHRPVVPDEMEGHGDGTLPRRDTSFRDYRRARGFRNHGDKPFSLDVPVLHGRRLAIVAGLLASFLITNRPEDAKWLTSGEREVLVARLEEERTITAGVIKRSVASALTNMHTIGTPHADVFLPQHRHLCNRDMDAGYRAARQQVWYRGRRLLGFNPLDRDSNRDGVQWVAL
jgi:hypothetical protein